MPRRARADWGGQILHVLNRGVRRSALFDNDSHYRAFEKLLVEAGERVPVTLLTFCLMPNHFHLVVRPEKTRDLSEFMRWLTVTHAQRRHAQKGTSGTGPVYQVRFKPFLIQSDRHFLTVCRYVERNALRAGPIPRSGDWVALVNGKGAEPDLQVIRASIRTGAPFGDLSWIEGQLG